MRSGDRLDTGTGPQRRRLTRAEAEAGCLPAPMTKAEWRAMAKASAAPVRRVPTSARVREQLRQTPGATVAELALALRLDKERVRTALSRMAVTRTAVTSPHGRTYRYEVA